MTQDVLYIESAEQAGVMLKPLRIELLRLMDRPRTCSELAEVFAETPQKIYYHVKALERAGLVERCGERQVRGATEGFYRARARSYWLTPTLVRSLGGATKVRDQTSLTMLCQHAERMLDDAGRLARKRDAGIHVPSLSLGAEISLPDARRRSEFLRELQETFERLATKFGAREPNQSRDNDETFRLTLACYPKPDKETV